LVNRARWRALLRRCVAIRMIPILMVIINQDGED